MNGLDDPAFWDDRTDYKSTVGAFTAWYSEQAWIHAALPPDASILDIAAGSGALTQCAAASGNAVLAIDFSAAMVKSIAELGLARVRAEVMDGQNLALDDGAFDAAFSMFGIMLFADWRRGLAEAVRAVVTGGLVCIGTWNSRYGAGPNLLIGETVSRILPEAAIVDITPGMTEWAQPERFRSALAENGLDKIRIETVTHPFILDADLLDRPQEVFQFSPIWLALSEPQRNAVLAEIREEAARGGGRVTIESPALIGFGIKAAE